MKMKGKFITLEGNDGSGKTTIALKVVESLQQEGYEVLYTREPGGIQISEKIREIILNPDYTMMDGRTEALLYAAARRQHLVEKVLPALQEGKIVICDRFVDSSLAYQGVARGLGIDVVYEINRFAIEDCMPDATIFLKVDIETGMKRIAFRKGMDRLDQEGESFHRLVAKGYEEVLQRYPERFQIVDATRGVEQVYADTLTLIRNLVNGND